MLYFLTTFFVLGASACLIKAMLFLWKTDQETSHWLQDLHQNLSVMGGLLVLASFIHLIEASILLSLVFGIILFFGFYVGKTLERYFSFGLLEDFLCWILGALSLALWAAFLALWQKNLDPNASLLRLFSLLSVSAACVSLTTSLKRYIPKSYLVLFQHEAGWNTRKLRIGFAFWIYCMSLSLAVYYPSVFSGLLVMIAALFLGFNLTLSIPTEFGIHYMLFGQCTLGISTLFLGLAHHHALLTFLGSFVSLSGLWLSRKSWGKASMYAYMLWSQRQASVEQAPLISAEDVAQKIQAAQSLLVIPGKGLIDASAHFLLTQCLEQWDRMGKKVGLFASSYAGRIPNLLPLLFQEAQLSQSLWCSNPHQEESWDLVLVIGANDLVNPALDRIQTLSDPVSLLDITQDIVFMRQGNTLSTGYWEVENPLLKAYPTLSGCFHHNLRSLLDQTH